MKANIEIVNMSIVTKRDGKVVEGTFDNGGTWTLWHVTDSNGTKYSAFMNGKETPPFQLGNRYDVEYEEEERGQYKNFKLVLGKKKSSASNNSQLLEIKEVLLEIKEILLAYTNKRETPIEFPGDATPPMPQIETEDQSNLRT